MADKKISGLPSASTPLAGTEVLPLVQSGVTDQVSVANLTAGRDVSVKKLNATDNFVVGTAGKGIDFSANSHAAGMTSELLNDYEEGTWTPVFATWTTAPSVIFATYTKIGRQVTVTLYANNGVNAGGQDITGLPFTSSATSAGAAFGSSSEITTVIRGSVTQSSTNITNFPTNNLTSQYWQIVAVYFV